MKNFLQQYDDHITGSLSGFDRLVFRGTLRRLVYREGMLGYLWAAQVLLKDFGEYVLSFSSRLKEASLSLARRTCRPVKYLTSSQLNKEKLAIDIAQDDNVKEGLICVLTCVEPCHSFEVYRDRDTKKLNLVPRLRKCLFLYHYYMHPIFGFMNARIQTWFPLSIQICMNGREWLARQMSKEGLSYQRKDNCFTWIENPKFAQELMDNQLKISWPDILNDIAHLLNPEHKEMFGNFPADYYWSVYQSELATDIMFRSPEALANIYPALVHHGIKTFSSSDVMRFLGRKITPDGNIHHAFAGEVVSDLKKRPEGIRIKHRINHNSIKLYDKQGSVLRAETTINDPKDFKVYRPQERDTTGDLDWRPMRKGIADLYRRAEVSLASNSRYLDALASTKDMTPLKDLTKPLCSAVIWNQRRYRALNPYSDVDAQLLELVSRGEFIINGFRNRDLQKYLHPDNQNVTQQNNRRCAAKVTRNIRLLRAHGLIKKVPKTHRYLPTEKGRRTITALVTALNTSADSLTKLAA